MKTNIAKRLEKILLQDKFVEPQKLLPVIKSDIRELFREYAELASDINLEIEENEDGYNVIMLAKVLRFKA